MSFLKTVEKKTKVKASDGPDSRRLEHGASNPANWVSKIQTGKNQHELKNDAQKLHDMVEGWQQYALEAHHLFSAFNMNGGKSFEMYSPILLKGLSREKLLHIVEICSKLAGQAPSV